MFGCVFPIDYLAGRDETGGKGWESGSGRTCAVEVFSALAGCGQLDHRFEFLLTARLKFQPLKIEGNKRLGLSKQPHRVVLFPALSLFFLSRFLRPSLDSAPPGSGMIANVIMSKYFTQTWSKGLKKKKSLHSLSILLNQQVSQLFWAQRGSRGWDYSLTAVCVLPDLKSAIQPCFFRLKAFEEVRSADETVV